MYKDDQTEKLDPIEVAENSTVEQYFESICLTSKENEDCSDEKDITIPF